MAKQYNREELQDGDGQFQKWVRLPVAPGERLQGQSRSTLYNWMDAGFIKSANIKQPGKLTGVRVIWLPSLMEFIERHVEVPNHESGAAK